MPDPHDEHTMTIERAARALYLSEIGSATLCDVKAWESMPDARRRAYRDRVRAAQDTTLSVDSPKTFTNK